MKANLAKQTFKDAELELSKPTPLVAFYKYKEPHVGMNPGIWVYADKLYAGIGSKLDLADDYLSSYSELIENPLCIEAPNEVSFGGTTAVKAALAFHGVVEEDDFEHDVIGLARIIYHKGHVIYLLFEHSLDGTEDATKEFELVDKTIRFV